jgi:hypothetical protein
VWNALTDHIPLLFDRVVRSAGAIARLTLPTFAVYRDHVLDTVRMVVTSGWLNAAKTCSTVAGISRDVLNVVIGSLVQILFAYRVSRP